MIWARLTRLLRGTGAGPSPCPSLLPAATYVPARPRAWASPTRRRTRPQVQHPVQNPERERAGRAGSLHTASEPRDLPPGYVSTARPARSRSGFCTGLLAPNVVHSLLLACLVLLAAAPAGFAQDTSAAK